MNNFVTFILVQFLFTIGFSTPLSTELPSSNCKMFCELCQDGFSLIHKNIEQFESVTNEEIVKFIDVSFRLSVYIMESLEIWHASKIK